MNDFDRSGVAVHALVEGPLYSLWPAGLSWRDILGRLLVVVTISKPAGFCEALGTYVERGPSQNLKLAGIMARRTRLLFPPQNATIVFGTMER